MLRTKIIANSISNLTDARYFAAWGVEAMGFDFQQVSVMQVNAFKDWISGPKLIGQFTGIESIESINEIIEHIPLDIVQLAPFASKEWNFEVPIMYEVLLESSIPDHISKHNILVLKSENPNFPYNDHLQKIKRLCQDFTCYLDFNIDLEHLLPLLQEVNPEGLILRGGEEEKVGYKSYDELDEILEALEED